MHDKDIIPMDCIKSFILYIAFQLLITHYQWHLRPFPIHMNIAIVPKLVDAYHLDKAISME